MLSLLLCPSVLLGLGEKFWLLEHKFYWADSPLPYEGLGSKVIHLPPVEHLKTVWVFFFDNLCESVSWISDLQAHHFPGERSQFYSSSQHGIFDQSFFKGSHDHCISGFTELAVPYAELQAPASEAFPHKSQIFFFFSSLCLSYFRFFLYFLVLLTTLMACCWGFQTQALPVGTC